MITRLFASRSTRALGATLALAAASAPLLPSALRSPAPARAQVLAGVTTAGLLAEMADLASMTRFPSPAYTTRQFSSYDRASNGPRWEWFANGDRGQYIRVDERAGRRENVMAEATGPGALVRLWSANPEGTLRVYLDGSETPVIEEKMADLLAGRVAGFPPPLGGERARGFNLYFPIPFAKSCRVTSDGGSIYYTAAVRSYAPGTVVETFRRDDPARHQAAIRAVAARLAAPRAAGVAPTSTRAFRFGIAPGQARPMADLRGGAAITRFIARIGAGTSDASLRGLVLRARFDGEAAIEAPLGDFFGTAPGPNPFSTLPLGIARLANGSSEMWSHWVMPFRQAARLEVVNLGKSSVALSGEVGTAPYAWRPDSMHFRANYLSRYDVATRPTRDLSVLSARGSGVFAGLAYAVDNPSTKWWGEGDEKVYVDGEDFPSWFGTGSEDYFGYAWCDTSEFQHAFHAQPRADGPGGCGPGRGHWGRASNNRFHIPDRIPFRNSISFDIELLHWVEARVNVATVAYWYAKPGADTPRRPLRAADVEVRDIPEYPIQKVAGVIEGESLRVVSVTSKAARAEPQAWGTLSNEGQMWWHDAPAAGDKLTLGFDAPRAGRYRVLGRFLTARDYGIHQLAVNGQAAGEPRDFFASEVVPTSETELGTFDLKAAGNTLEALAVGKNAGADTGGGLMFGLDYLRLVPSN